MDKKSLQEVFNSVKRSHGHGRDGTRTEKGLRRKTWIFIGAWVPRSIATALEAAVQSSKLDRSKFLREALEEKNPKGRPMTF